MEYEYNTHGIRVDIDGQSMEYGWGNGGLLMEC